MKEEIQDRSRFRDYTAISKKGNLFYYDWGTPKQTVDEVEEMNCKKYSRKTKLSVHRDLQFFNSGLECSLPNKSTVDGYCLIAMIRDMAKVFNYIPYSEIYRMLQCLVWMMTEGLKIHGRVKLNGFCTIDVTRYTNSKEMYRFNSIVDINRKYTQKGRIRISRKVRSLINPLSPYYLAVDDNEAPFIKFRSMTGSINLHKHHYRRGKILLSEKPFEPKSLQYIGYSKAFRDLVTDENEKENDFESPRMSKEEWKYIEDMYYDYRPNLWKQCKTITDEFPGPYLEDRVPA